MEDNSCVTHRNEDVALHPQSSNAPICPRCGSAKTRKKGIVGEKQNYICLDCGRNFLYPSWLMKPRPPCPSCGSTNIIDNGTRERVGYRVKSYKCKDCGKNFLESKLKPMLRLQCELCNNTFYTFSEKAKICDSCKNKKPKKPKFCPVCGKEVIGHNRKTYCSIECLWKANNLHAITKKKCVLCHREFETSTKQKYCDVHCQAQAEQLRLKRRKEQQPKKEPIIKTCAWCHAEFKCRQPIAKFCCNEHREFFDSMKKKIFSTFMFNSAKTHSELEKLERLGVDYKLD